MQPPRVEGYLTIACGISPTVHRHHCRSETNAEIQQERNLFYVGMTRAEDLLLVTAHMQVSNSWRGTTGGPSAFLEPLLDKGDAAGVRVRMIEDW
jgi:superfamily I DNA/RNA helicase